MHSNGPVLDDEILSEPDVQACIETASKVRYFRVALTVNPAYGAASGLGHGLLRRRLLVTVGVVGFGVCFSCPQKAWHGLERSGFRGGVGGERL